ncbi:MAG: NUDIX domain-containing protein [Candidatus Pacebacteria bacterium]|nr:NUDIX domain-containing protein [Candidatus Paceibacterota bacterium]
MLVTLSKRKDTWYIPGGKREEGETDHQALVREIEEELTVQLLTATIKKYGVFEAQAHGKPDGTIVRMICYLADYQGELTASAKIEKLDFFDYSRKQETSPLDHLIFDNLKQKGLIE